MIKCDKFRKVSAMSPRTSVYVTYDDTYIYFGYVCHEPAIEDIATTTPWFEGVEVFLAPLDAASDSQEEGHKKYFQLGVNTLGGYEAYYKNNQRLSHEQEQKIKIGIKKHFEEKFWSAEIAVPFEILQPILGDIPSVDTECLILVGRNRMTNNSWPHVDGDVYRKFDAFALLSFDGNPDHRTASVQDRKISLNKSIGDINIDGILDEPAWKESARIVDLVPLASGGAEGGLREIKPKDEIENLLAGYQKKKAFTTHISRELIQKAGKIIEKESWAKESFARIKATADYWTAMTDEELYNIIPDRNPLAYTAGYNFGSPICGVGDAPNTTSALRTSLQTPNMWECRTCGRWFGPGVEFDYAGEKYSITDDGTGWCAPQGLPGAGNKFYFVAAWRQYVIFTLFGSIRARELARPGCLAPIGALDAMATVYAVTREKKYAHKALLILTRIAELHPDFKGTVDIGHAGRMYNMAWPSAGAEEIIDTSIYTYDIVFDYLYQDDDLVAFFNKKSYRGITGDEQIKHEDIQRGIERDLFGYMYDWLLRFRRQYQGEGDYVLVQAAQMAGIGRALENPIIVNEALSGKNGFRATLRQQTLNDGRHFYNSLAYHNHMPFSFKETFFRTYGYHDGDYVKEPLNLFTEDSLPFARMVDYTAGIWSAGRIPFIGDAFANRHKVDPFNEHILSFHADLIIPYPHLAETVSNPELFLRLVKEFLDPDHINFLPRKALKLIVDIAEIRRRLESAEYRPQRSELFTDSGLAVLRTDNDGFAQNHIAFQYGIGGHSHSHRDQLALNIIAHGYALTGTKGYPFTFAYSEKVPFWTRNTAGQKVVRIDGRNQNVHDLLNNPLEQAAGKLHAFTDNEAVAIVDGANEKVYPDIADLYRRAVFLIKDPGQPFVVDIYNVKGGGVRDYQFYAQSDVRGENFEIIFADRNAQMQSLTQPPQHIDDRFLYDLAEVKSNDEYNARWWIGDRENTGLLMHMLASENERTIIIGKGQSEGDARPVPCDVHVIAREEGQMPSRFVSLFFAYQGVLPEYTVKQLEIIEPGKEAGSALGISVSNGTRTYLIFHDLDGERKHVFSNGENTYTFKGISGVIVEKANQIESVSLASGTLIGRNRNIFAGEDYNEGRIVSINHQQKSILVDGMIRWENIKVPFLIGLIGKPWTYRVVKLQRENKQIMLQLDTLSLSDPLGNFLVEVNDRVKLLNEIYIAN